MHDLFISYARKDIDIVKPIIESLEGLGVSVWWDNEIPAGETWYGVISDALKNTKCQVVFWSKNSIISKIVLAEVEIGFKAGSLIPVKLEDLDIPFPFNSMQAADLSGWSGSTVDPEYQKLIRALEKLLGKDIELKIDFLATLSHKHSATTNIGCRTLLLGANGKLGQDIVRSFTSNRINFIPLGRNDLDITSKQSVEIIFEIYKPSVVINSAGYTYFDKAESENEIAFLANTKSVEYIVSNCEKHNIPIVHISCDSVFDGNKGVPYLETDTGCPINVYGETKYLAEQYIVKNASKYLIIRCSWLYGAYGHNFVNTILRLTRDREALSVIDDQYGSPTCTEDLAIFLSDIIKTIESNKYISWGIYHYSNTGVASWYDFASEIISTAKEFVPMKLNKLDKISTSEYPVPAQRPRYSVLECKKTLREFGTELYPWKKSVRRTVLSILNSNNEL